MKDELKNLWSATDRVATLLVFLLVGAGLVMIRSATIGTRFAPLATKQVVWAGVGAVAFVAAFVVPYETWIEYAYIIYGCSIASLVAVFLIGHSVAGSRSWITMGSIGFQPSEFAKVACILAGAAYLKGLSGKRAGAKEAFIVSMLVGLPAALTFLQPDFGTATTFLPIAIAGFYLSDLPLSRLLKWSAIAFIVVVVLFIIGWFTFFKVYQKERLITFVNPSSDARGAGYQVKQAEIAVGSGKLTGKGLYSGSQNRLNFLPAPHTDFIFGVLAEETGFVGSIAVLGAFLFLLSRFLAASRVARDLEGRFIAIALFSLVLYHVIVNIGMVIGLLPTTGIPLPFLSYGGSFLVSMCLLAGLAGNVYARRFVQ